MAPQRPSGKLAIGSRLAIILKQSERKALISALLDHDRNITYSAAFLGISRRTMQQKIKLHAIDRNAIIVLRAELANA